MKMRALGSSFGLGATTAFPFLSCSDVLFALPSSEETWRPSCVRSLLLTLTLSGAITADTFGRSDMVRKSPLAFLCLAMSLSTQV